ncbi:uncharacterized protein LOC122377361 [Amphibalanus amphitrite]|uniref:uncharacterized protein LOC122377361 n=1 Tax=Amphibalanus amphitrite TaxID=1232801 RepID=UPI001C9036D7|nr:uncharacterized protein LOC122377361 [Amphibalanus amphitrite]
MAARAAVVVAVCVLLLGVHGFREPLACSIRCCSFSPRCLGATHMSCHCPDTNTMQLRSGDIPSTVQYIEIFPAQSVTIGPRALYDLYGLRDLTVRDVHSLEVLSDGLALHEAASLQTLRLDRIRQVTLRQDALSGRWPADAELEMHHIGNMHMEQRALHFEADGAGPRVLLENVADLHAKSDAFRATVKHLILVNVSMRACQPGTFRGKVGTLSLLGCRLQSLESRCVQPDVHWGRVSVNNCDLGDVRETAFTGKVDAFNLEASNVSRLLSGAVSMEVQRLKLERLHVRDMAARALDVSVCGSVAIMESRVVDLRRHALAAVKLADCRRRDRRPFTIHLLHVGRAESGALAVHPSVPASAVNWDSITFDTACSCETRADVAALVAGDDAAAMTDTQRALTDIVWDRSFCTDADGNAVLLSDTAADCPDWEWPDDGAGSGGGEDTSLDQSVVFYGVIGGVSAVVLAFICLLVAKRHRVSRALGCAGSGASRGEDPSVCDTLQSRRTACTAANSTLSSVGGGSAHGTQLRYEKGLPDLLTAAPGVDLSPQHPGSYPAPQEHIYAEIGPNPVVADYADPRDSLAFRGEQRDEAAVERGQYAEIAPLVGDPELAERAPPPPSSPPPAGSDPCLLTNEMYCPVTHL